MFYILVAIRGTKTKNTLRLHLTQVRIAKIKKASDSEVRIWVKGTLFHCWCGCKEGAGTMEISTEMPQKTEDHFR